MGQTYPRLSLNEGFGDFLEGWVPFLHLLDIQAKSWMVGRYVTDRQTDRRAKQTLLNWPWHYAGTRGTD